MENFQDIGVWIRIRIRFVLRGWIRIRFVLRGWIRIRSISDRIRNPACAWRAYGGELSILKVVEIRI